MTTPAPSPVAAYLAEVREREQAATAQPWYAEPNTSAGRVWVAIGRKHFPDADMEPLFKFRTMRGSGGGSLTNPEAVKAYRQREADAAFVVTARSAVPALVAALEAVLARHHHVAKLTRLGPPPMNKCAECDKTWPCPTYQDIAAKLAGEAALRGAQGGAG